MNNQFIVYNKVITVNRIYLTPVFFKSNSIDNIYNIKIVDVLISQNMFVNLQDCNNSNNTNIMILDYNVLKSSMPSSWKNLFIQNPYTVQV